MSDEGLDTVIGGSVRTADPAAANEHASKGQQLERDGDRVGAIEAYRKAVSYTHLTLPTICSV